MTPENPKHLYPLFITSRLADVKEFYTSRLGFTPTFDLPTYLQIRCADEEGPELCFMTPDAFPDGVKRPEFGGEGVVVSIPTANADEKHRRVVGRNVEPLNAPSDKPWGWRSFFVRDPIGVVLDFFHVIEKKEM